MHRLRNDLVFYLGLLAITVNFLFLSQLRKPYLEEINLENHQWLTFHAHTVLQNWYEEGMLNEKMLWIYDAPSVEIAEENREYYVTYLPGSLFIPHLINKLSNSEPTIRKLRIWNSLNHFVLLLLVYLLIYLNLPGSFNLKERILFLIFILSTILYLSWVRGFNYLFQQVYFADTAVLPAFVLFVLLESFLLKSSGKKNLIIWLQTAVFLYGIFCDWLFLVLYAFMFIRWVLIYRKEPIRTRQILFISVPLLLAVCFMIFQLEYTGEWQHLFTKMKNRSLETEGGFSLINAGLWEKQIRNFKYVFHYSNIVLFIGCILLYGLSLFIARTKQYQVGTISLASLIFWVCFGQYFILFQHSSIHYFSLLKIGILIALTFGLLLPYLNHNMALHSYLKNGLLLFVIFSFFLVTYKSYAEYYNFYGNDNQALKQVGGFIHENTGYYDVVFSENLELNYGYPPMLHALTMKRVYNYKGKEIDTFENLDYRPVIFSFDSLAITPVGYELASIKKERIIDPEGFKIDYNKMAWIYQNYSELQIDSIHFAPHSLYLGYYTKLP